MGRLIKLACLVSLFAVSTVTSDSFAESVDTKKVPTERILIPNDAPPAPLTDPGSSTDEDNPLAIPTDNLPSLTEPPPKPEVGVAPKEEVVPTVLTDIQKLPAAVRQTRQNLLDAAKTGNIENLRPFISLSEHPTNLSLGGIDGDPIDYLKSISGDDAGQEILAILIEILEMGFVHTDAGTDNEIFVWPYFFSYPLNKLTPPQKVELFRILTAGDLQDSQEFGSYIFYRTGIKPDGTWSFFLAGD